MVFDRGKIEIIQPFLDFWPYGVQDISLFDEFSFDKACDIISEKLLCNVGLLISCRFSGFLCCWWWFYDLENLLFRFLLYFYLLMRFLNFDMDFWGFLDLGLHLNGQTLGFLKMSTFICSLLSLCGLYDLKWWRGRW